MSDKENKPNIYLNLYDDRSVLSIQEHQERRNAYFEDLPQDDYDQLYQENYLLNQFELLPQGSLHTISRGSLEIIPQPLEVLLEDNIQEHAELTTTFKSPEIDPFSQKDKQITDSERKLIVETQQMIISDVDSDSFSEKSAQPWPHKKCKGHGSSRSAQKRHQRINKVKHLIRELKKRNKQGNSQLFGNFELKCEEQSIIIMQGLLKAVLSQKEEINGLLISSASEEMLLKMKSATKSKEQIKVEHWNKSEQKWMQFTLAIETKQL